MGKKEAIFFIVTMIVCVMAGISIYFIYQYIGIPYPIALLVCSISGFVIVIIGRTLYTIYK